MQLTTRLRTMVLAVSAATLVATGIAVPSASATPNTPTGPVTANWVNTGAGFSGVIDVDSDPALESTVVQNFRVEGGDVVGAFCVDAPTEFVADSSVDYSSDTRASTGKPNLARVAHIATNSASIGTPLADPNAEASAVQIAIWTLTDGADVSTVPSAALQGRVAALLADTTAAPELPSAFTVDIAATLVAGNQVRLDATFRTNTGTGQDNRPLTVTYPGGSVNLTTNASGDASTTIPAPASVGAATATWNGVLPGGSVISPPTGQDLVTVDDAPITRSATTAVPAGSAPPTTEDPQTPPPTDPTPPNPGDNPDVTPPGGTPTPNPGTGPNPGPGGPTELPHTGSWLSPSLALLAAGALGLGLWLRRRAAAAD